MLQLDEKRKNLLKLLEDSDANELSALIQDTPCVNACWVDGSMCQMGSPGGKLTEAPLNWCSDCQKLTYNFRFIQELGEQIRIIKEEIRGEIEEELKAALRKKFEEDGETQTVEQLLYKLQKEKALHNSKTEEILSIFIKVICSQLDLDQELVFPKDILDDVL